LTGEGNFLTKKAKGTALHWSGLFVQKENSVKRTKTSTRSLAAGFAHDSSGAGEFQPLIGGKILRSYWLH
jgi:hypothetical protein